MASIISIIAKSISILRISLTRPILRRKVAAIRFDGDLLQIQPRQLHFPLELKKQISCSMQLTNNSDYHVAFKVKQTNPKNYCVRPYIGVVMPHSTCEVIVMMKARLEAPPDMQCKDKFLIQSVVVNHGISITREMFDIVSGNQIDECKLSVMLTYVPTPLRPPSPARQGPEEGSSSSSPCRALVSENGTVNRASDSNMMSEGLDESNENTSEVKALVSNQTEEEGSAVEQNNMLQQELEMVRRQGVPVMYVIIIGLIGILLEYLFMRT